jgi:hypothetical protein
MDSEKMANEKMVDMSNKFLDVVADTEGEVTNSFIVAGAATHLLGLMLTQQPPEARDDVTQDMRDMLEDTIRHVKSGAAEYGQAH